MSQRAAWHCPDESCQAHGTSSNGVRGAVTALHIHQGRVHPHDDKMHWHRRRAGTYELRKNGDRIGTVYLSEGEWWVHPFVEVTPADFSLGPYDHKRDAAHALVQIAKSTVRLALVSSY